MYRRILILFFVSIFLPAQSFNSWKNLTSQMNTSDVTTDQDYIWASTDGGAYRFDPADSTYEQFTLTEGMKSQNLTTVFVDNKRQIWFGSGEGIIDVYNSGTQSFSSILDLNKSDASLKSIIDFSESGDTILALSEIGLSLINTENLSFNDTYQNFSDIEDGTAFRSAEKIKGRIYICTSNGLVVQKPDAFNLYLPESWEIYLSGSSCMKILTFENNILVISGNKIVKFTENSTENFIVPTGNETFLDMVVQNGKLYILSSKSIYVYSNSTKTNIYTFSGRIPVRFFVDTQSVYTATNKGIIKINGDVEQVIMPNTPPGNTIFDIDTDSEGNVWCATGKDGGGKGVYKWDGKKWTVYNTSNTPEFHSNDFHRVNVAEDNTVFLSNWGKGLTVYSNGNFTTYDASNTDLEGEKNDSNFVVIDDVQKDDKGNTWILNEETGGLKNISVLTSDNTWYHYAAKSPLSSTNYLYVSRLAIDYNGTKWYRSRDGALGLYYFNDNGTLANLTDDTWGVITTSGGLNSNDISAVVVDQRGELWVGSTEGINILRDPSQFASSLTTVPFELRQLDNTAISAIEVDPLNQKWIGTSKGIFVYSSDGSKLLANYNTTNSPLPDNNIICIASDEKNGIIYFGTNYGISSLKTTSVKPAENFSEIYTYPNPYVIGKNSGQIVISGLIEESTVKVFSLTGKLIREIVSPGGSVALWDGTDENGDSVSSGVYLIIAYDAEATEVGTTKLLIIR